MTAAGAGTIIIGVGNPFRCDDGVGIAVLHRLRARLPRSITMLEATGEGASLIEAWKDSSTAIVIDAMQSGAAPGTIHRIDAGTEKIPSSLAFTSSHAFGLAEAIEMARALGRLPPKMIVYGIEGRNFSAGAGLSPDVERAVEGAVTKVLAEL